MDYRKKILASMNKNAGDLNKRVYHLESEFKSLRALLKATNNLREVADPILTDDPAWPVISSYRNRINTELSQLERALAEVVRAVAREYGIKESTLTTFYQDE